MFHMPLFFFVSGYCFKDKYLANPKRFAVNKVKGLYVPFVKWSLISFFRVGSLTFFSGFFIVMGRAYKRINVDADKWWVTFAAFMVVAVGSVWCSASMLKYTAAQILPYSACAILGTIMVLNLSHQISLHQNVTKRVLMFVGDHTLEVLTWHFLTFKIVSLLIIWIHCLPVEQLGYFPTIKEYATWYWPLYSLLGIGLPIGVVYIRKKYYMEKKQNRLAIVIPAYKSTFLAAALDSIAAQTCRDFTLYIGDDCSPNNLGEIVDRYRDKINLVYRRFDTNMGGKDLVAQWERCIDMSQGEEWIWLFSDDDVMEENCVKEFYKTLLQTNESYDLYHFNVKVINDDGQIIQYPMAYPQNLDSYSYYKGKLQGRYISLVVENIFSRKVYERYRGFKKFDLAWGSDTATWVLYSERKGFYTIDNACVLWRSGSQNISPNVTAPIAERKVKALVAFFTWANSYFKENKHHVLFTNMRAFVSRMAQFRNFAPQDVCRKAIVDFCTSHDCKAFAPILSFLIIFKNKND